MDITSITSSVGAYTSTPPQSSSLQQAQESQQADRIKPAERRESQATESQEQAPRPVTNTLGQETGKLISVTA